MKCYYRVSGGERIKGRVTNLGTSDVLVAADDNQQAKCSRMFRDPEIAFEADGIRITGYDCVDEAKQTYKLIGVDISPGWVKPK